MQELRKDREMSQTELADHLKVSSHTISSYERGKSEPDDALKVALAKLFDVSLDYLCGLVDKECSYLRTIPPVKIPQSLGERDLERIREYVGMLEFVERVKLRDAEERVEVAKLA